MQRHLKRRLARWSMLPAMLAALCPGVFAQTAGSADAKAQTSVNPRDLNGVWTGALKVGKVAPMLPAAQAKFDGNTAELKQGRPITKDPAFICQPPGIPHAYQNGLYAIEIVQIPGRMFMFFESAHLWRTIWTDGRELPTDSEPLWLGYSVGRWEGNDLIVETGSFNDRTWLDNAGHPHSTALRVTERFRRVDNSLQIEITINDPLSYTAPWGMTASYQLRPHWELTEAFCVLDEQSSFHEVILGPNAKP